jgi:hypothetical protein
MAKKVVSANKAEPTSFLFITGPDDLLDKSVIYQDIFQKGEQRGAHREGEIITQRLRFG